MTFPAVPRDVSVELYLTGTWIDVIADVLNADQIVITRGRPNESGQVQPATCELTLKNYDGNYSPRNPTGIYYGEIGRNTPLRVAVNLIRDTFTRTVSPGWGSDNAGHAYAAVTGAGGSVLASDAAVSGGVGTISVPATNAYRLIYFADPVFQNVDVAVTTSLPVTNITGASVDFNVLLRMQSADAYYLAKVSISTAEAVTIQLRYRDDAGLFTDLTSPTATGITHSSTQALRIRAQAEGHALRAKVWPAAGNEPYGWQVSAHATDILTAGWVGIRDSVTTGNTNTLPLVFSHDNLVIRSPRFAGEVAAWHQKWDITGVHRIAPIEAASVLRRIGQGAAPLLSTLYRGVTGLPVPAIAYWPCEEGPAATSISSAIGGTPLTVAGATDFAVYSGFAASRPLPTLGVGCWYGAIPSYVNTGQLQLRCVLHFPSSEIQDNAVVIYIRTDGGYAWEVHYQTGGGLDLELWQNETNLFFTGNITFDLIDKDVMLVLDLEQNGADVDWTLRTLEEGSDVSQFFSGTRTSLTLTRGIQIGVAPFLNASGVSIGHIMARKEVAEIWDLQTELNGFTEESAVTRMARLCDQEGIQFDYVGGYVTSALMGSQRPLTLTTLLQECADTDLGTLYESRGEFGLRYRTRGSQYNQISTVLLNYGLKHIAPPFLPIDDDQLTRNDVTATRVNGGSARAVLETGRMSVLEPSQGGVGRYDTSLTVNTYSDTQLPDIAGWVMFQGTVDESRYPQITVNFAAAALASDEARCLALLDLDIDDLFQVFGAPATHAVGNISQLARGYTETISLFEHIITFNGVSRTAFTTLQVGSGSLDWGVHKLDTSGSTLVSSITSTQTSFTVAVPSGALWTTSMLDMALAVEIEGELMYIGAISGTSSPQTFSFVTRSVNGVVKTHSAGSAVRLVQPAILGL